MALCQVEHLTKRFGGLEAVSDVSFAVEAGQIVALIGPNGAGKTTVFNLITRLTDPTSGHIWYDGQDLVALPPQAVARVGISRTFQNIRLFRRLSVLDNVIIGFHSRTRAGLAASLLGLPQARREQAQVQEEALQLLEQMGLLPFKDELAANLPYGEQRRLEIVRALAAKPKLLLLDEPAAGLNVSETKALMEQIARLRSELGQTILLIEHDMKLVMGVSDRVVVLDHGKKIAEGPPEAVQADQRVIEAYLGRGFRQAHESHA